MKEKQKMNQQRQSEKMTISSLGWGNTAESNQGPDKQPNTGDSQEQKTRLND